MAGTTPKQGPAILALFMLEWTILYPSASCWAWKGALIRVIETGDITIRSEARLSWFEKQSKAYNDSLGVAIPVVSAETGVLDFDPTISGFLSQITAAP
jgi:hypothetical protein